MQKRPGMGQLKVGLARAEAARAAAAEEALPARVHTQHAQPTKQAEPSRKKQKTTAAGQLLSACLTSGMTTQHNHMSCLGVG